MTLRIPQCGITTGKYVQSCWAEWVLLPPPPPPGLARRTLVLELDPDGHRAVAGHAHRQLELVAVAAPPRCVGARPAVPQRRHRNEELAISRL